MTVEVPFVRIYGDAPLFTALVVDKEANVLLRKDTREKLKKKGIEVQIPMEIKARKTVFLRRLDRHVGQHSKEQLEEEIKRNHQWAREVVVTKIRDYTHVVKVEFGTVEEAEKALDQGLLLFYMHIAPD